MSGPSPDPERHPGTTRAVKRERQRTIRELVARQLDTSQDELAGQLAGRANNGIEQVRPVIALNA